MEIAITTPGITDQIEREYQASQQCAQDAVIHAINVGVLLREAKKLVGHGEFENYISDNFDFTSRTARNYMSLAENKSLLEDANRQRVSVLTVREALRLIADETPRARKTPEVKVEIIEPEQTPHQTIAAPSRPGQSLETMESESLGEGDTRLTCAPNMPLTGRDERETSCSKNHGEKEMHQKSVKCRPLKEIASDLFDLTRKPITHISITAVKRLADELWTAVNN